MKRLTLTVLFVCLGLGIACAGAGSTDPKTPATPKKALPSCDPGDDWTEDTISDWMRKTSPWKSSSSKLVFAKRSAAKLDGKPVEWMVMAEGNREEGSFVQVFTDPPILASLKLDGTGSVTLNAGDLGILSPTRCGG